MLVILLSNRRRIHYQGCACERTLGILFNSRDIPKSASQLASAIRIARNDGDLHVSPPLGGGKNRGRCASASQQSDPGFSGLATEQRPRGGVEAVDVGIVAMQLAGLEPERVHGSDPRRDVGHLVTAGVNRDLVRNGDVPRCVGILELPEQCANVARGYIDRLIDERNSGGAEGGILEYRRQGVTHWVTE